MLGAYALLLLLGSVLPGRRLPRIPDWSTLFAPDKVAHFVAYGVFALLLSVFLAGDSRRWPVARAIVFAVAFGTLMEMLQAVSGTGREFDPVDMAANALGALLGGAVSALFRQLRLNR